MKNRNCCDGECDQGRNCPNRKAFDMKKIELHLFDKCAIIPDAIFYSIMGLLFFIMLEF